MDAQTIRALRFKMGMTQAEFCALMYVSRGALSAWEQGARVPSPYVASVFVLLNRAFQARSETAVRMMLKDIDTLESLISGIAALSQAGPCTTTVNSHKEPK